MMRQRGPSGVFPPWVFLPRGAQGRSCSLTVPGPANEIVDIVVNKQTAAGGDDAPFCAERAEAGPPISQLRPNPFCARRRVP
jgi:hypothetical protein